MALEQQTEPAQSDSVVAPRWLLNVLILITCSSIFSMAMLTFLDVILRYFFSSPLRGVYEINALLLGLMTLAALPLVTVERRHITVDLFDDFIRGNLRYMFQLLMLVFQMVMIGFIAWRIYAIAVREWHNGWVTIDLQISRAPLLFVLAALGGLTAIFLLIMIVQFFRGRLPVIPRGGGQSEGPDDVL